MQEETALTLTRPILLLVQIQAQKSMLLAQIFGPIILCYQVQYMTHEILNKFLQFI